MIENEKRQIAFATQSATERYLTFLEKYPLLDKRIPQLHIASYLGITPTQLSRIRKELIR
ncbi:MAG: CRP-like cAMP-binding protein [Gammaproteobacteria bacterium]